MDEQDFESPSSTLQRLSVLLLHHSQPNSTYQNGGAHSDSSPTSTSPSSCQLDNLHATLLSRTDAIFQTQRLVASLEHFRSKLEVDVDELCEQSEMVWAGKGGIRVAKQRQRIKPIREGDKKPRSKHREHSEVDQAAQATEEELRPHNQGASSLGLGHPSSSSSPATQLRGHSRIALEKRVSRPKLESKELEKLHDKAKLVSRSYETAMEQFESSWQSIMRLFEANHQILDSTLLASRGQLSSDGPRDQVLKLSPRNESLLAAIFKSVISKPQDLFRVLISQKGDSSLEELIKPIPVASNSINILSRESDPMHQNSTGGISEAKETNSGLERGTSTNLLELVLKLLVCCDGDPNRKVLRVLDFVETLVVHLLNGKEGEAGNKANSLSEAREDESKPVSFSWTEIERFLLVLMDSLQKLDLRVEVENIEHQQYHVYQLPAQAKEETIEVDWDPDPLSPSKDLELEIMSYLKETRKISNINSRNQSSDGIVTSDALKNVSPAMPTKIGPKRAISLSHSTRPSNMPNLNPSRFFSSASPPSSATSSQFSSDGTTGLAHRTLSNLGSNAAELWNYGMSGSVATLTSLGLGWRNFSSSSNETLKGMQVGERDFSDDARKSDERPPSSMEIPHQLTRSSLSSTSNSLQSSESQSNPTRATSLLRGAGSKGNLSPTPSKAMATSSVTSVPPSLSLSRFVSHETSSNVLNASVQRSPSTPRTRKISLDEPGSKMSTNSFGFPTASTTPNSKIPIASSSDLADIQEDRGLVEKFSKESIVSPNLETSTSLVTQAVSKAHDSLSEVALKGSPTAVSVFSGHHRIRSISDVGRTSPASTFRSNQGENLGALPSHERRSRVSSFGNANATKDDIRVLKSSDTETGKPVSRNGSFLMKNQAQEPALESQTRRAARRVLRSLLSIGSQAQAKRESPSKTYKVTSLPLTIVLCRRLLLDHFPCQKTSTSFREQVHRRLILLLVIRWYSFTHLGKNLLLRPNRSGKCFGFENANSVHFGPNFTASTNLGCKILSDVWIYDEQTGRDLGELHREIYESLLKVSGFGKASGNRNALNSLDEEAKKVVGLFGVAQQSSSLGTQQEHASNSCRGQISALKLGLPEIHAIVGSFRTVALKRSKTQAGTVDNRQLDHVTNHHRPITDLDLEDLSADLKQAMKSGSTANSESVIVFISRRCNAEKYLVGFHLGRVSREIYLDRKSLNTAKSLAAGRESPESRLSKIPRRNGSLAIASRSSRADSLQKPVLRSDPSVSSPVSFVPFPTSTSTVGLRSTSTAQSTSSPRSHMAPSVSVSSSGFSISTVGHRRNGGGSGSGFTTGSVHSSNGSIPGWGSPPCSPSDEGNGISDGSGEGFFDVQASRKPPEKANEIRGGRKESLPRRSDSKLARRSDSIPESCSPNSVAFPSMTAHQKDGTLTRAPSSRDVEPHVFTSIRSVVQMIEEAQIPINELKRGIFTLLHRFGIRQSHTLRNLLRLASASSKQAQDYETHFLYQNTLSWLDFVASNHPALAFGLFQVGSLPLRNLDRDARLEEPHFQPILSCLLFPLQENEKMIRCLSIEAQSGSSQLELSRRSLLDSARTICSRLFELRAKAWYASEVRIDRVFIESRAIALNQLEERLAQAVGDDAARDEGSAKQWLQRQGIYDFEVGGVLENYFQDLDGAFEIITGDASRFFSSPLWKHESTLANGFLSPSESAEWSLTSDRVIFNFGAAHPSLLRAGENRTRTLAGLESFLQRVQLLCTGLLLSEAMAGAPTSDADDQLSDSLSSRSLSVSSTADTGPFADLKHQDKGLSLALRTWGATELLKRFELHPSPHQKMKALLVLERLVIAQLTAKRPPSVEGDKKEQTAQQPASTPRARSPVTPVPENPTRSTTAATASPQQKRLGRPPSPLATRRPALSRADSDQSKRTDSTKGVSVSFRPMSLRVSNKGRRALSMYGDTDEEETDSSSGLSGLTGPNGRSIHEMLASFIGSGPTSAHVASPSQVNVEVAHGDAQIDYPERSSLSSRSQTLDELSIDTQHLNTDTSSDLLSARSTSNLDSTLPDSGMESDRDPLFIHLDASVSSNLEHEKESEPPNTDQVVGALESVLLNSDCRPQDILVNLQIICAFSPTSVLDFKDEGKAMWDLALAALSLRKDCETNAANETDAPDSAQNT